MNGLHGLLRHFTRTGSVIFAYRAWHVHSRDGYFYLVIGSERANSAQLAKIATVPKHIECFDFPCLACTLLSSLHLAVLSSLRGRLTSSRAHLDLVLFPTGSPKPCIMYKYLELNVSWRVHGTKSSFTTPKSKLNQAPVIRSRHGCLVDVTRPQISSEQALN
jgi:hypothetical protein